MLSEERQAEIIALMKKKSRDAVLKHLADDGFKTSGGALSEFWSWWHLREQYTQSQQDVQTFLENLSKEEPTLPEEQLFKYGQQLFGILAVKNESVKDWAKVQTLRLNDTRTSLEARRIAVLEKKAAAFDQAKEVLESKLTPEEQKKRLKDILK